MREARVAFVAATVGSALWGLSGVAAQVVVQDFVFPVWGLTMVRMLGAAGLLLLVERPRGGRPWTGSFASLAIVGLVGCQVTYLEALFYSNVTTATLLAFLYLPMVAGYELASGTISRSWRWAGMLGLAIVGTILLIGTLSPGGFSILITPLGLLFGLLAAVTGAYYTLAARRFVQRETSWWVTTWGFLIGGLATIPLGVYSFVGYRWPTSLPSVALLTGLILVVVVAGTLLAFALFVFGLRRLAATEAGVAGSFEPISAAVAGLLILGVALSPLQYAGGALIVLAVAWLGASVNSRTEPERRVPPP